MPPSTENTVAYETMSKAELVKLANGGDFGAQNELLRREFSRSL